MSDSRSELVIGLLNMAPALVALGEAAERYEICKSEQADRQDTVCKHVHWNGGPQAHSCVALLFGALDALKGKQA